MEFIWLTPDKGFVKLNVYCIQVKEPLILGNINEVGVIIRDTRGLIIWAALGLLHDMDVMQATLWAAQSSIIEAWKRDCHAVHLEIVNREVFDALRFQDFAFPPPNLEDAMLQFNTMFLNNFIEGVTARIISIIPSKDECNC